MVIPGSHRYKACSYFICVNITALKIAVNITKSRAPILKYMLARSTLRLFLYWKILAFGALPRSLMALCGHPLLSAIVDLSLKLIMKAPYRRGRPARSQNRVASRSLGQLRIGMGSGIGPVLESTRNKVRDTKSLQVQDICCKC